MPSLTSLEMLGTADLTWPISFRYVMLGSHGWTQTDLSVDAPDLNGNHDASIAVGARLWRAAVATATTTSTQLAYFLCVIWKLSPFAELGSSLFTSGVHFGSSAPRARSGVLITHTGHADDYAARRTFAFGMPSAWQNGDTLTSAGWDNLLMLAHAQAMGLSAAYLGGGLQLLHMYPNVVPSSVENLTGVGFRRVTAWRVCEYVDKAPDFSDALWP